jgi:uncharacterized protein (DUF2235 family)
MPENIAISDDGTGNSSAKLFKTDVWRLYQALDTTDPPPAGRRRQIAYYHDGGGHLVVPTARYYRRRLQAGLRSSIPIYIKES